MVIQVAHLNPILLMLIVSTLMMIIPIHKMVVSGMVMIQVSLLIQILLVPILIVIIPVQKRVMSDMKIVMTQVALLIQVMTMLLVPAVMMRKKICFIQLHHLMNPCVKA